MWTRSYKPVHILVGALVLTIASCGGGSQVESGADAAPEVLEESITAGFRIPDEDAALSALNVYWEYSPERLSEVGSSEVGFLGTPSYQPPCLEQAYEAAEYQGHSWVPNYTTSLMLQIFTFSNEATPQEIVSALADAGDCESPTPAGGTVERFTEPWTLQDWSGARVRSAVYTGNNSIPDQSGETVAVAEGDQLLTISQTYEIGPPLPTEALEELIRLANAG